jgi:excisionase family DNA binding protein
MNHRRQCPPGREWAVSVAEAALRLNIGEETARKCIREGTLAAVSINGTLRVPVQGIEEWLGDACRKAAERREAA